jgi:hypothetical protein
MPPEIAVLDTSSSPALTANTPQDVASSLPPKAATDTVAGDESEAPSATDAIVDGAANPSTEQVISSSSSGEAKALSPSPTPKLGSPGPSTGVTIETEPAQPENMNKTPSVSPQPGTSSPLDAEPSDVVSGVENALLVTSSLETKSPVTPASDLAPEKTSETISTASSPQPHTDELVSLPAVLEAMVLDSPSLTTPLPPSSVPSPQVQALSSLPESEPIPPEHEQLDDPPAERNADEENDKVDDITSIVGNNNGGSKRNKKKQKQRKNSAAKKQNNSAGTSTAPTPAVPGTPHNKTREVSETSEGAESVLKEIGNTSLDP